MSQPPTLPPSPPPPPRGGDSGDKVTVTILFIVIGLPPGLCSLYFTPATIELLRAGGSQSQAYAALFGVPCLVGLVIFGIMLWLLIRAWRQPVP
jgi:hypothetical protein